VYANLLWADLLLPTCFCTCSLAVRVHRDALLSMRGFWEVLMHSNVQFRTLARCIKHMDQSIKSADRVYKWVHAHDLPHEAAH
jgi:hypothetical protein